jgi:hypothetical protein
MRAHVSGEGTLMFRKIRRGRGAKNIRRMLSRGRTRLEQARAAGIDISVLPPDSKIRKRAEADWEALLKHGFGGLSGQSAWPAPSRGVAGREAARKADTSAKRSHDRRAQALDLIRIHPELTAIQIADRLQPPLKGQYRDRTVRRYLTGR